MLYFYNYFTREDSSYFSKKGSSKIHTFGRPFWSKALIIIAINNNKNGLLEVSKSICERRNVPR